MSDLISRKALLDDFRKTITEQSGTMDWLNMINRQETAYDVDKVVEELEEVINNLECNLIGDCENDILNVVKRGGKDE